jgi:O-antigen ligase
VILAMGLCVVPLTFIEPFGSVIGDRLSSFTNLDSDVSYNGRQGIYEANLGKALNSQLGLGLGGTWESVDSAVIDTLLSLGWIGTLLYVGGLIALLFKLYQRSESKANTFASASKAICLSIFFMLLFSSLMLALPGTVLWVFLGMGTAADTYYSACRNKSFPY